MLLLFGGGLLLFGVAGRILRPGGRPVVIEPGAPGVLKTTSRPRGRRVLNIPIDEIRSILVQGGAVHRAIIGTRWRTILIEGRDFDDPNSMSLLVRELGARIAALPDGPTRLKLFAAQEQLAQITFAARAPLTRNLLLLLFIAFGVQLLHGATTSPLKLIELGANVPTLVRSGELYRLISANFLHGGEIHLLFNAVALYSLGGLVERLIGSHRMLIVFAVSALSGSLASTLMDRAFLSVGASTAIFGLLGSFAVIHMRLGDLLPVGLRQSGLWWLFILGINGAISFVPVVDVAAHAGGFIGGVVSSWLVFGLVARDRLGPGMRLLALTLAGLFLAGILEAASRATSADESSQQFAMRELVNLPQFPQPQLNEMAWMVAVDPGASRAWLDVAERAAEEAVRREPADMHALDTLATVKHRLGRRLEAVRDQRKVLAADTESAFWATQLARFLAAGPLPVWLAAPTEAVELIEREESPEFSFTIDDGGVKLSARSSVVFAEPRVVYALLIQGERRWGLARLHAQAGADVWTWTVTPALPRGVTLVPALIDAPLVEERDEPGVGRWWPEDESASRLP